MKLSVNRGVRRLLMRKLGIEFELGGVPAMVIKYRFDDETIAKLLELKWWDYDIASIPALDWSDVHKTIAQIEAAIASGLKPYRPEAVTCRDFKPYCGFLGMEKGLLCR